MSDAPPTYFALSRNERDHLLAAAQLQDGPGGMSGQSIQQQVEELRGGDERPGNAGTYEALDMFCDWGWMVKGQGYAVTDDGFKVLADAKAEIPE